jgi:hypothetical protein
MQKLCPHVGIAALAGPMEVAASGTEQAANRYQSGRGYMTSQDLTSLDLSSIVLVNN